MNIYIPVVRDVQLPYLINEATLEVFGELIVDAYGGSLVWTIMATPEDRKELDWDLSILVPEKGVSRKIRVTSNESVSAVMIKIASKLGTSLLSAVFLLCSKHNHNVVLCWINTGAELSCTVLRQCRNKQLC